MWRHFPDYKTKSKLDSIVQLNKQRAELRKAEVAEFVGRVPERMEMLGKEVQKYG